MALIAANAYTVKPKLMRSGHSLERRNARSGGRRLSRLMRHLSLGCNGSKIARDKAMQNAQREAQVAAAARVEAKQTHFLSDLVYMVAVDVTNTLVALKKEACTSAMLSSPASCQACNENRFLARAAANFFCLLFM